MSHSSIRVLRILIATSLALTTSSAQAGSLACAAAMLNNARDLFVEWWRPAAAQEFDQPLFEAALTQASSEIARGSKPALSPFPSLEEQMAFVQAHCGRAGAPGLMLDQALCEAGARRKRELVRIFEKAGMGSDFMRSGVTTARIETLVSDLYRFQNGNEFRTLGLLEDGRSLIGLNERAPRANRLIGRAVAERLAKRGLVESLEALGRLKAPTSRDAIKRLVRDPRTQFLYAALINVLNATSLAPTPYLPPIRWVSIPEKTLVALLERGDRALDEAWPELYERFGRRMGRQETYRATLTKATNLATLAIIGAVAYGQYVELNAQREADAQAQADVMIQQLEKVTTALREQNDAQDKAPSLGQELFEMWKTDYTAKHGHAPKPNSREYKKAVRIFLETRE